VAIVPKSISNSYAIEICQLLEFAKSLNVLAKEKKVYLQVFAIFNLAFTKIVDPTLFYGNLLSWRQIFYSRALRPSPFARRPSPFARRRNRSICVARGRLVEIEIVDRRPSYVAAWSTSPFVRSCFDLCRPSPFVGCCLVHVEASVLDSSHVAAASTPSRYQVSIGWIQDCQTSILVVVPSYQMLICVS
jgi:hypothetical protein